MMQDMFEVKAHMIERKAETEATGMLDSLQGPFTHGVDWFVAGVRKHPFVAILVLLALLFIVWRLNK